VRLSLSRHKRCAGRKVPWLGRRTAGRLREAAAAMDPAEADVELIVVDDAFIRELNRDHRGVDRPTDVLSFSYLDDLGAQSPPRGRGSAGEVYVSWETVEARAAEEEIPPEHLFLRVGVHGLLHIIGYDHDTRSQTSEMESQERRLLMQHLTSSEVEELF
jgi:probable rRNA maturation factor